MTPTQLPVPLDTRGGSSSFRQSIGRGGEDLAAAALLRQGYRILARNHREGRTGEIDLIAEDPQGELVFVEVKTVTSPGAGHPLEKITAAKQARLQKLALRFCHSRGWMERAMRFDAVGIRWEGSEPQLEHVRNAFLPPLSGYHSR